MLQRAALIQVANLEGLGEILAEVVRSTCLQLLAIAHHGLPIEYARGVGAGEALGLRFSAGNDGDRRFIYSKISVDIEHLAGFGFGFIIRRVRRVPFLPEKFERAQK